VTVIRAMNAAGMHLPPMIIFPRKRIDTLMNGAPPQSVGCCSDSGWTDSTLFVKWLEHFAQVTNCSVTSPPIIVMDGMVVSIHDNHLRRGHGTICNLSKMFQPCIPAAFIAQMTVTVLPRSPE